MKTQRNKQPVPAPAEPPVQQPDKRRELSSEWRQHVAVITRQLTEGEARVLALEGQISRIRRDQEFMRTHLGEITNTLGSGMNNPRLSADGTGIEGD